MIKIIITLLLLSTVVIGQFRSYDIVVPIEPYQLTVVQKEIAINHFAEGKSATWVKNKYYTAGITTQLVKTVYAGIKSIETYAYECMSGNVIESDIGGVITYYPKTTTQTELLNMVNNKFPNQTDITVYLLTKMVLYSKKDGTGTWAFYLSQFGE